MDCNMPFMDGFEASQQIRTSLENEFSIPVDQQPKIIAVTGHVEPKYISKCYSCGMNQVLSKPVEHSALRTILESSQLSQ